MRLDFASKRVLITGVESFTGWHLEKYLKMQGFEVWGTNYANSESPNHMQCDLTKKNEIYEILCKISPDYVINLAGRTFVADDDSAAIYEVNFNAVENLLSSCVRANLALKKVILVSSATIYGNQNIIKLDETLMPKPPNHYAVSKLAMEFMANLYRQELDILVLRAFNYTGINQDEKFVIPKIVNAYKRKQNEIFLGNTKTKREYNDVRDVVKAYANLLNAKSSKEPVNLCSSSLVSLDEVIQILNKISGIKMQVKIDQKFVRKNEIQALCGDNTKLLSLIENPFTTSLQNTLETMYHA